MPTIKPINTTPGSTITAGDRAMMSIKKKLKAKAAGAMGAAGKGIMGAAKEITHRVGGDNLADFAGSKIAKAIAKPSDKKFVADKTSLKSAMKSVAGVAGRIGVIGLSGMAGTAVNAGIAAKLAARGVGPAGARLSSKGLSDTSKEVMRKATDNYRKMPGVKPLSGTLSSVSRSALDSGTKSGKIADLIKAGVGTNPFAKKLMNHNASIKAKLLKNKKTAY